MAALEAIDSGAELGSYRVTARLGSEERAYFAAASIASGEAVCLLELLGEEVESYRTAAAQNPDHAHLAHVKEVIEHDGVHLLVFEQIEGTTLTERLQEVGKKSHVEAVGAALRVSDALSNLHDKGGVHGFIHTDSVLVDPPDRLGPILTFAPVPSDERTFHSPERGETGKPSVADDAWAAAGLLHMMLTGSPPPQEGYASTDEIAAAGVEHPALQAALLRGLSRDAAERSRDIRPLKRELARWFVEHASEEAVLVGSHSTVPPPLPAGSRRNSQQNTPLNVVAGKPATPARRPRFGVLAVAGTLVGLTAAWGLSRLHGKAPPAAAPVVAAEVQPPAQASATAIDLSEVPVTGEDEKQNVQLDKTAACVASYLPKGAFAKAPDFGWLCGETDPNKGARQLRVAIVGNAAKGTVTDAMKLFSRLGWSDMAVFAVVRAGCCEDPRALTVPPSSKGCDSMADALTDVSKHVLGGRGYEEPFKKYTGAVSCELDAGQGATFGRTQRPQPGEDTAFKEFVEAIAH